MRILYTAKARVEVSCMQRTNACIVDYSEAPEGPISPLKSSGYRVKFTQETMVIRCLNRGHNAIESEILLHFF